MYLKSIEVHGFKSFANKINFQFHNGITAIVGPNGSGKSNVADAVRWVLGEQRIKQLRGASMQDVIFSGTEMRKPLSYAYVGITLDNSDHQLAIDFDEVTVSRRIYRSGESEYLINQTPCRLKDINELFYDTGIGKEGYSIIGQGQIDSIISGKPEERRELFDEAAGIVKFKRRKSASEKKLEEEKQNLLRVNDILSELEKQIGPLEKQAEKAKIYLKKKEELKTLDVNMFLLENNQIKSKFDDASEKYEIADKQLQDTNQQYESIKEEYDSVAGKIELLEEQIEEERKTISQTDVTRGKLEGEINVLKEQIRSIAGNEEHQSSRKTILLTQVADKEKEIQELKSKKDSIEAELSKEQSEKKELEDILLHTQNKIAEFNHAIENGKNTIIASLNERAEIKSKLERMETMIEQIAIQKSQLTSKLVTARTDEEKRLHEIEELEHTFQQITEEIKGYNTKQGQNEKIIESMKQDMTDMDSLLRNKQEIYHQSKAKLESLSNITERYEGYGGSVKKVMEQKDKHKGIVGVVADIIQVEKKYETAIETALGGNIQNIVTDDEDTAKEMISFLKKEKGGRATFLPLTSIKNAQEFKTPEVLTENGVVGLADSIVKTQKCYLDVAKAMLGRIVVVDTIDNAVKIARKYQYGIRMVTLEGELFVPGGAISGGAFKNNSNLLSRRREIEELQKQVLNLEKDIKDLEQKIESTKTKRNQIRTENESLKMTMQDAFIRQNTARLNVTSAKEKQTENQEGFEALTKESTALEEQEHSIISDKSKTEEALKQSLELEQATEDTISSAQEQLEKIRLVETSQSEALSAKDVSVEKILQQNGFEQMNLERLLSEMERLVLEKDEILKALLEGGVQKEQKEKDIAAIEGTIEASHTSQSDVEKELSAHVKEKEELGNRQKSFFTKREELAEQITALDKEVYRLNAQKEKFSEAIQTQIEYMWNEYEITLHDASLLKDETMNDLPGMKKQVNGLRDEIRQLGDVNVNAIEDYKNVSERYQFLKTQHDDLVNAEKTLIDIITELDSAMRKQFKEKFQRINQEFDKVFKELFGGGKGTLELMEDEDILEAGVCISVQPPGKKLQNMVQLSGGEKSLTAIALLFAIQNLKPSPFCLLDEIEAALDENNVIRFAKYLHKLTQHTQFIVITHRRGTMECADRLYGITMQEKGVSALVSVNLVEDEIKN